MSGCSGRAGSTAGHATGSPSTSQAGSTASHSSGSASPSTAVPSPSDPPTESNPPGDIPDNIAYVASTIPGTTVSVKVPEGWSSSSKGTSTTFTDKLNTVQVDVTSASTPPTTATVSNEDVPRLQQSQPHFALGTVSQVQRKGGPAILLTYQDDSATDPVTGTVIRDAVERYTFYRTGTRVDLTLSGPQNADNVDPWKTVSDSVSLG